MLNTLFSKLHTPPFWACASGNAQAEASGGAKESGCHICLSRISAFLASRLSWGKRGQTGTLLFLQEWDAFPGAMLRGREALIN